MFLGQRPEVYQDRRQKTFNWGGKVGVNAALPIVKSLTIDNQEMEDIRLQYKVGYQAAVFARVNIDRFYIQPSLAWQYTEGDMRFNHTTDGKTACLTGQTRKCLSARTGLLSKSASARSSGDDRLLSGKRRSVRIKHDVPALNIKYNLQRRATVQI
ncbi:MAG: outer membrane beta-barrel protein [Parabacteroides merdae]